MHACVHACVRACVRAIALSLSTVALSQHYNNGSRSFVTFRRSYNYHITIMIVRKKCFTLCYTVGVGRIDVRKIRCMQCALFNLPAVAGEINYMNNITTLLAFASAALKTLANVTRLAQYYLPHILRAISVKHVSIQFYNNRCSSGCSLPRRERPAANVNRTRSTCLTTTRMAASTASVWALPTTASAQAGTALRYGGAAWDARSGTNAI